MKSDIAKVMEKITKLLALAKSANEHEAALAASRAQALLAQYNLNLADLKQEEKVEIDHDGSLQTDSRPWRRRLGTLTARLYFCEYFYEYVKQRTPARSCGYIRYDLHNFVGAPHNIVVARMMFEYLIGTIDRLADQGSLSVTVKDRTSYKTSFRLGCSLRLCQRILARMNQAMREGVEVEKGETLPALVNLYQQAKTDNVAFMNTIAEFSTPTLSQQAHHQGGMVAGVKAGDKIGLDRQVGAQPGHLLTDK